jgi:hypothetical protein
MSKSMMEKVRVPKLRPPEPTPKEKAAWDRFMDMTAELNAGSNELSPLLKLELDRLAAKGNPLAIRLKERLAIANFKPRGVEADPLPPPPARRIRALQWGRPKKPIGDQR